MKEQSQLFFNMPLEALTESLAKCVIEKIRPLLPPPQKKKIILYSRKEASALLGISVVTLDTYTKQGIISKVGTGARGKYIDEEIERARLVICKSKYKRTTLRSSVNKTSL